MPRPLTLVLAALVSAPALWSAFVVGTMSVQTALIRFLVAVPVCALLLAGFRAVLGAYAGEEPHGRSRMSRPERPARRRTDPVEEETAQ